MNTAITRAVAITRLGERPGSIDLEITLSPAGEEPETWIDVTMSVILLVDMDMQPTVVDMILVEGGPSQARATVPLGEGFATTGPVRVKAMMMHGTRHCGMVDVDV